MTLDVVESAAGLIGRATSRTVLSPSATPSISARFDASTSISLPAFSGTIFTQPVETSMSASSGAAPTTLPAWASTSSRRPGPHAGRTSMNGAPPEAKSWEDTRLSTLPFRRGLMAWWTAAGTSTR